MTEKIKEAIKTLNRIQKHLTDDEYFNLLECIVEDNVAPIKSPYPVYQDPPIPFTTITSSSSDKEEKEWREAHYDK